jgi:hypothetical protein
MQDKQACLAFVAMKGGREGGQRLVCLRAIMLGHSGDLKAIPRGAMKVGVN